MTSTSLTLRRQKFVGAYQEVRHMKCRSDYRLNFRACNRKER